ncbi:DUF3284 domain-containing protein [Lacticaseibacillus pabuli]|uniref:DUF3284 domain-containing protein n=1 Tax=Lacticaseibacillus pabuli TaxID=3025672 RepID=A0ABY7WUX5_9LACO|nr:DUF3284 domain-containing protein [Lacticaseibacillus sp. KACC 23028]WDF82955.1 DUF3284 domain-containing protein [Lacticaseibacillus sp. KACC 23028]
MRIELTLAVPAEYFFNSLVESALYDIETCTGQQLSVPRLKSYHYRKMMPNGRLAHYHITACSQDKHYSYEMRSGNRIWTVDYTLVDDGSGSRLVYKEDMHSRSQRSQSNDRVAGWVFGWMRKRRFKKMAHAIEAEYAKQLRAANLN